VIDFNGVPIGASFAGPTPNNCCNEDLALAPDGTIWKTHFSTGLYNYNATTGTLINSFSILDLVGATFVGNQLWVSKWNGRSFGELNTSTGVYTSKININSNAGGLAYDLANNILWGGEQGGLVQAYDLNTFNPIAGSSFQPFGAISDTIDGLAYVSQVPEPNTILLLGAGLIGLLGFRKKYKKS
jgi:hypothetical protein